MNNNYALKVLNKPLYYVELVSCLNHIAENTDIDRFRKIVNKSNTFFDKIKNLRLKGLEFFEFALCIDNLDDMEAIISNINAMSHTEFIYTFFGDSISKEEVELIYKEYDKLNDVLDENIKAKWLNLYDLDILFNDTNNFKEDFLVTLKHIDSFIKEEAIIDYDVYSEKTNNITLELKEKSPLNIAQDIMGKKFKRVYDFNYYLFAPSFYYINKPMRIFNFNTQLLVYPVNLLNSSINSTELAKTLKIIGDKSRLDIIKALSSESYSGKTLAAKIGVSTPTISHHLDQLKSIGLIYEERDKNTKYYTLNKNAYKDIIDTLNNYL
ncbi:MAG: ArsR/SmtB family transcription factor [Clostridium sp.]|uniref:ArsR/SmtB family transcription factor n=1 Tax=Clostridium sp. TaxID=1506 RepID=UPI003D6CCBF3